MSVYHVYKYAFKKRYYLRWYMKPVHEAETCRGRRYVGIAPSCHKCDFVDEHVHGASTAPGIPGVEHAMRLRTESARFGLKDTHGDQEPADRFQIFVCLFSRVPGLSLRAVSVSVSVSVVVYSLYSRTWNSSFVSPQFPSHALTIVPSPSLMRSPSSRALVVAHLVLCFASVRAFAAHTPNTTTTTSTSFLPPSPGYGLPLAHTHSSWSSLGVVLLAIYGAARALSVACSASPARTSRGQAVKGGGGLINSMSPASGAGTTAGV